MNFYNENNPRASAWLRQLIADGLIPPGHVDERSIHELKPDDLRGFTQCHFFAGIGGWSEALRLADWPAGRPVWTGSCPCQPFSNAGKQRGQADARHLWPELMRLIRECRPPVVFGEQVASAIGFGWLDGENKTGGIGKPHRSNHRSVENQSGAHSFSGVSADLEAEGYAVGSIVLGAHSVGAPHRRQRLFWVADGSDVWVSDGSTASDSSVAVADAIFQRGCGWEAGDQNAENAGIAVQGGGGMGIANSAGCEPGRPAPAPAGHRGSIKPTSRVGSVGVTTRQQQPDDQDAAIGRNGAARTTSPVGFWDRFDILNFTDGKRRRAEPGSFPLAHGVQARVVRISGYGNAIVPQLAAEFIKAFSEIKGVRHD